MFRDIQRKKQALAPEECAEILKETRRGVLSVTGDDGYPYGMPLNHYYDGETGTLWFHSGKTGHKIDALRRSDKVSFCVMDEGVKNPGEWWLTFRSVVVFGRIRFLDDYDRAVEISRRLSLLFTDDEAYIEREIERSGPGTLCWELIPEHMTGKRVVES